MNADSAEKPIPTETVTPDALLLSSPAVPTDAAAPAAPAPPPPADVPNPFAGEKDVRGIEFHPAKFRLKDGKPQRDSRGRFVPLNAGRPGKNGSTILPPDVPATAAGSSRLPPDESTEPIQTVPPEVTAELSTEVAIGMVQTALIMIGEEEGVLDEMEQRMLRRPMLRLLTKYNLTAQMTPELETGAVIAALLMRRLKKPKTQSWFQRKLEWLRAWWLARKVKKTVPDPFPHASS